MTWLLPDRPEQLRNASATPAAGACVRLRNRRGRFCLPSVVVIGAMRTGTSALTHYLLQHPHLIRNADGTEVHYFSDPFETTQSLLKTWPAYVGKCPAQKNILTLDKTAQYLTGNLDALRTLLPSARVVAVLREPGQRAYSEFRHHCRAGRVVEVTAKKVGPLRAGTVLRGDALRGGRFASAALCYGARGRKKQLDEMYELRGKENPAWILNRGTYRVLGHCAARHFDRFLAASPPEGEWTELGAGRYVDRLRPLGGAVTLVDAADLRTDAGAVARRVLGGLRLDAALYPRHLEPYVPSHVDAPEPLLPATRARLDDVYRGPNAALRRLAPDLRLAGWS